MILIFRTERGDMQTRIILADLPFPRTVVLDLPHHGKVADLTGTVTLRFLNLHDARRFMHASAPCGGGAQCETGTGLTGVDALITIAHTGFTKRPHMPVVLHGPSRVTPEQVGTFHRSAVNGQRHGEIHGGDRLDGERFRRAQPGVGAYGRQTRIGFKDAGYGQTGLRGIRSVAGNRWRCFDALRPFAMRGRGSVFGRAVPFRGNGFEFAAHRLKRIVGGELGDFQTVRIAGILCRLAGMGRNETQLAAGNGGYQR